MVMWNALQVFRNITWYSSICIINDIVIVAFMSYHMSIHVPFINDHAISKEVNKTCPTK